MNLALAFAANARRHPAKTALFWGEARFSYHDLWTQSLWVAAKLLADYGVRRGDRVGIWLRNCPEFVPALFGIFSAGAVAVPINCFLKPAEVSFILADAGINVLIVDECMDDSLGKLAGKSGLRFLRAASFGRREEPELGLDLSEADLAVLIYTSGTTGHPKGAMLSHGNLLANVQSCRVALEAVGEDRFAVVLPLFHSFMLTVGLLLPLLVGGSMVLIKTLHPPKSLLTEMFQHQATLLPAVPQFFRALTHGAMPAQFPLRLCISGGAPLPAALLRDFTGRFSIPLLEGYGLSEASPVVSFQPIRGPWKAGSIGKPLANIEVSIQNEAGEVLPPGESGEVCVRGSNVMLGYWNQPEATAAALRQGWLLTGDIGHADEDGYFYITDRKKDMLLVNGINVYPREVEEVLYRYPGVKEAAVIGVPDARRGEQPLAFIASEDGMKLDEERLLDFAREQLADYKVPRRVVFLPALPHNATGKMLKTELRTMAVNGA
ncbi:MAG: AMP-binding protein [Limisphaerales bacterium]